METKQSDGEYFDLTVSYWGGVIVAGLVAGVAMGLIMDVIMDIMGTVGSLYTIETVSAGWVSHLWHSVVFALIFGAFFIWDPLSDRRTDIASSLALGLGWGVFLWAVAASVVMPLWLGALGLPAPDIPVLNPVSGIGHVLYGGILGVTSAVLNRRL